MQLNLNDKHLNQSTTVWRKLKIRYYYQVQKTWVEILLNSLALYKNTTPKQHLVSTGLTDRSTQEKVEEWTALPQHLPVESY